MSNFERNFRKLLDVFLVRMSYKNSTLDIEKEQNFANEIALLLLSEGYEAALEYIIGLTNYL